VNSMASKPTGRTTRSALIPIRRASPDEASGQALRIDPDPASKSGRSVRTIGYSASAGGLVTVITLIDDGVTYGVNAWRSNNTDIRRYGEEPG